MIWGPACLMLLALAAREGLRFRANPSEGWLPRVLPFVFAGAAVWFVAAVFLTVDLQQGVRDVVGLFQAFEAEHPRLTTALLAFFGVLCACAGFARAAWRVSESLCEPPENAVMISIVGPVALGLLGVVLLALTYMRL